MRNLRCEACKARHVKCDKKQPVCQQCHRNGFICTWPANDLGSRWRPENDYAAGGVHRPRGPVRAGSEDSAVHRSSSSRAYGIVKSASCGDHEELLLQPTLDLLELARCKYEHRFLRQGASSIQEVEGMLAVYGKHLVYEPGAALDLTVSATALAYFGLTENSSLALSTSRAVYQRALIQTRLATVDSASRVSDETMLAVMMLSSYEITVGSFVRSSPVPSGFLHIDGAVALLKLREVISERQNRSLQLDSLIRRRVVRTSINKGVRVPTAVSSSLSRSDHSMQDLLDIYMVELADLQCRLAETCRRNLDPFPAANDDLAAILQQAKALDMRLESLLQHMCSAVPLQCSTELTQNSLRETTYSGIPVCSEMDSLLDAKSERNKCRSTRLRTNNIIVCISDLYMRDTAAKNENSGPILRQRQQAFDLLECLAAQILATVPEYLGRSTSDADDQQPLDGISQTTVANYANKLIFPLHTIASVSATSRGKKETARRTLRLIGRIVGNRVLQVVHGTDTMRAFRNQYIVPRLTTPANTAEQPD